MTVSKSVKHCKYNFFYFEFSNIRYLCTPWEFESAWSDTEDLFYRIRTNEPDWALHYNV